MEVSSLSGLEEEMEGVIGKYGEQIFRLAFAYLKDRAGAEDVAQEVFLAYMEKAPGFLREEQKKSWLMRVTGNKCKNLLKSAWHQKTVFLEEELHDLPEHSAALLSAVLSLEEKYRIPIHLFYYGGYSLREIARLLRSNPATVGTWLARGRALLKSMMGDDWNE